MKNYLSLNGLSYFFNKLQDIFVGKSYVDELISNIPDELPNYTDSDNNKILTIEDGSCVWKPPSYVIQVTTQANYDALETKDDNTIYIIEA